MHFYPFHVGDYQSHTGHLTDLEDLAYRRMLDWCYLHEKPLPKDTQDIAKIIRMRSHCDCIAAVLTEFFESTETGWISKRVVAEIEKFYTKSESARNNANKRWQKHKDAIALQTQYEGNAIQNQEPVTKNQEPLNTNIVEDKPSTMADCPHEKILDLWKEVLPEMPQHLRSQWNTARQQALRVRWRAVWTAETMQSEQEALDYWRRLFMFIRGSKFLMGNANAPNRKPFQITLEWLIKPANFSKVVEGKYHE